LRTAPLETFRGGEEDFVRRGLADARGGQPYILGDDTLGNAQHCRDPFVGQLGVELEP